jgi:hypothetical protein
VQRQPIVSAELKCLKDGVFPGGTTARQSEQVRCTSCPRFIRVAGMARTEHMVKSKPSTIYLLGRSEPLAPDTRRLIQTHFRIAQRRSQNALLRMPEGYLPMHCAGAEGPGPPRKQVSLPCIRRTRIQMVPQTFKSYIFVVRAARRRTKDLDLVNLQLLRTDMTTCIILLDGTMGRLQVHRVNLYK